jgi:hypothetical protein
MSITRQEPGPAGLVHTAEADGLLGEAAHYGGQKSPSAGQRLAPLRELIDDRLPLGVGNGSPPACMKPLTPTRPRYRRHDRTSTQCEPGPDGLCQRSMIMPS